MHLTIVCDLWFLWFFTVSGKSQHKIKLFFYKVVKFRCRINSEIWIKCWIITKKFEFEKIVEMTIPF